MEATFAGAAAPSRIRVLYDDISSNPFSDAKILETLEKGNYSAIELQDIFYIFIHSSTDLRLAKTIIRRYQTIACSIILPKILSLIIDKDGKLRRDLIWHRQGSSKEKELRGKSFSGSNIFNAAIIFLEEDLFQQLLSLLTRHKIIQEVMSLEDKRGYTFLISACRTMDVDCTKLEDVIVAVKDSLSQRECGDCILEALTHQNKMGFTALGYACQNGYFEIAKTLFTAARMLLPEEQLALCVTEMLNPQITSPLINACVHGYSKCMTTLFDAVLLVSPDMRANCVAKMIYFQNAGGFTALISLSLIKDFESQSSCVKILFKALRDFIPPKRQAELIMAMFQAKTRDGYDAGMSILRNPQLHSLVTRELSLIDPSRHLLKEVGLDRVFVAAKERIASELKARTTAGSRTKRVHDDDEDMHGDAPPHYSGDKTTYDDDIHAKKRRRSLHHHRDAESGSEALTLAPPTKVDEARGYEYKTPSRAPKQTRVVDEDLQSNEHRKQKKIKTRK